MTPLVSVLMPVRDYSPYLGPAVQSILNQSLEDLELIIIGYDNIRQWFSRLPEDSRVRYHIRERPGIVAALNEGLHSARGTYIARMDDDDISLAHRLEAQLEYLENNPDTHIAGACIEFFSEDQPVNAGNLRYAEWLNELRLSDRIKQDIFIESPLPHPTFFAHKDVYHELEGYQDHGWAEDYDLLLRAHLAGMNLGKPEGILLRWREHANRLTRLDSRYSRKQFLTAKAWALSASTARERDVIICGTGRNARDFYDALTRYGKSVQAFVEHDAITTRTSKRNRPVISYRQLLDDYTKCPEDFPLIVSVVSAIAARDEIRTRFQAHGLIEGQDFIIAG